MAVDEKNGISYGSCYICRCNCKLASVLELECNLLELYKLTKLIHSLMTSVINTKQGKGNKELLTGALMVRH